MKIVVLVKHVPDATGERSLPRTGLSIEPRATDCCPSLTSTPWSRLCRSPTTARMRRSSL